MVPAIEKEADMVFERLRTSSNPSKVWEKWKANIKAQLMIVKQKLRMQDSHAKMKQFGSSWIKPQLSIASLSVTRLESTLMQLCGPKNIVTTTGQDNQDTAFNS